MLSGSPRPYEEPDTAWVGLKTNPDALRGVALRIWWGENDLGIVKAKIPAWLDLLKAGGFPYDALEVPGGNHSSQDAYTTESVDGFAFWREAEVRLRAAPP
jgi:hypothetical protein